MCLALNEGKVPEKPEVLLDCSPFTGGCLGSPCFEPYFYTTGHGRKMGYQPKKSWEKWGSKPSGAGWNVK